MAIDFQKLTMYIRVIQMKVPPICKQKLVKNN